MGLHPVHLLTILATDPRGIATTREDDGAERKSLDECNGIYRYCPISELMDRLALVLLRRKNLCLQLFNRLRFVHAGN
jgi:hypothetical protein